MTYAIIKVAGKQYRVREGERLLVDRLAQDEGATFTPTVLLVGGDGAPVLEPADMKVTAKVLGAVKGPKIRIGKYKKRTGYRRHTGFRASLTRIQIESIGGKTARVAARPKAQAEKVEKPATTAAPVPLDLPAGYADMTIADIKAAAGGWDARTLVAALAFEREHANRKGAIAALESALTEEGDS
jgi:large subunit ribosomal protein L21